MSWTEANIAKRRNITDLTGNISRTAGDIAALRESKKNRNMQAMGNLANVLMEMSGRKWKSGEAEKERDWRTGERLGAQEYGTSERLGSQEYGTSERLGAQEYGTSERLGAQEYDTSERKAGEAFKTEHEFPWREKIAAAGRNIQNIGGKFADPEQQAIAEGYDTWKMIVAELHPDWVVWDQYGEKAIAYDIPDEGWDQFRQYMKDSYPSLSTAAIDSFIQSIRNQVVEEDVVTPPVSGGGNGGLQKFSKESDDPVVRGVYALAEQAGRMNMPFQDRARIWEIVEEAQTQEGGANATELQKELQNLIQKYAPQQQKFGFQPLEGF